MHALTDYTPLMKSHTCLSRGDMSKTGQEMHTPLIILADSHTCLSHGDDMEQSTHPLLVNACKGDWMSSDKEQIGAFWSESVAEKYQHREESLVCVREGPGEMRCLLSTKDWCQH